MRIPLLLLSPFLLSLTVGAAESVPPEPATTETTTAAPAKASGFLGVSVADSDDPAAIGLRVVELVDDSPADQAGLMVGDLLLQLDDQLLVTPGQLAALVRHWGAGSGAVLVIRRNGAEEEVPVILQEAPAELAQRRRPGGGDPTGGLFGSPFGQLFDREDAGRWPDLQDFFQDMRQDMPRFRQEDIQQQLRQWHERLRQRLGGGNPGAVVPAPVTERDVTLRYRDENGEVVVTRDDEGVLQARVTDAEGQLTYDGPVQTPEQRAKLPAGVRPLLESVLQEDRPEPFD